ncbi:MAG TPA: type II toxin-antitoxin system VapC family toxin [Microlunatus sp.]
MIVDTSVLIAILGGEDDGPELLEMLIRADRPKMSAATFLEAGLVIDGRTSPQQRRRLDDLVRVARMEIVPFDADQARVARVAYQDFGRGSGHPARLNFGDCFAYALATVNGEPLLFEGDDFAATGVWSAR